MTTKKRLGKIQLKIEGFNQTRLLNNLISNRVDFFNLKKSNSKTMTLWLFRRDAKKAFAIFNDLCYNYYIVADELTQAVFSWGKKRIGALIGTICFVTVLIFSNCFVWRVEIHGLNIVPLNSVQNILKQNHTKQGMLSKSVDRQSIKTNILQLDNVVDVTINMRGTTLVVTVFENFATTPTEPGSKHAILSLYDAVITRVVATEGTAVVVPGDKVFAGEQLITPFVYDTQGNVLKEVEPQGTVYGTVTFSDSKFFTLNEQVLKRTGKSKVYNSIDIFGVKLRRQHKPYSFFELQSVEQYLLGHSFVPIKVITDTYYELNTTQVESTLEDKTAQLLDELRNMLILKTGSNNPTVTTLHDVKQVVGGYRIDVFVTAEMRLN
ncbi:MAG: sporulation protein YqfD [Clostridiales bacterium]|jgi:similar to stage IV sporulation protein|nr:sporulation protein YqfD [Clostridiales bacterium]